MRIHATEIHRAAVIVDLAAEKAEHDFQETAAAEWAVAVVEAAALAAAVVEETMKR
jgi:hypothetical protein